MHIQRAYNANAMYIQLAYNMNSPTTCTRRLQRVYNVKQRVQPVCNANVMRNGYTTSMQRKQRTHNASATRIQ